MTTFTFDTTVPAANNAPRNDQPVMQTNNASTSGLISVDHVGFNISNGGAHKQVQLLDTSGGSGTIPAGLLGNGYETLYSSSTAGAGELWFVRGASPTGVHLTGPGTPNAATSGSTFLPGGLVLQWGRSSQGSGSSQQNYLFPTPFPNNCFSIQTTPTYSGGLPGGAASVTIRLSTISQTGFQFLYQTNASNYTGFLWIAIGN